MKHIIVGSKNPVKLETVTEAFALAFPDESLTFDTHDAPSGVPDQPFGSAQTREGARNRAAACATAYPDADLFVGLEGGLEHIDHEYWSFAWMCVRDKEGTHGFGRTGSYVLPPALAQLIREGKELGHASDFVFNEANSKHKGATVGILTNGLVSRKDFYRDAVIFALIPFLHDTLYTADSHKETTSQ